MKISLYLEVKYYKFFALPLKKRLSMAFWTISPFLRGQSFDWKSSYHYETFVACGDLRKYWKQSFHHYWQYQELLIHDMILLPIFLTCQRHCKVLIGCNNKLKNLWNCLNYSNTNNFICLSYFITRKMKNIQEFKGSMLKFKCLAFKGE